MSGSNFQFLEKEFPVLFNIANAAKYQLHNDPVTALFKLRQLGEKIATFVFQTHDIDYNQKLRKFEAETGEMLVSAEP